MAVAEYLDSPAQSLPRPIALPLSAIAAELREKFKTEIQNAMARLHGAVDHHEIRVLSESSAWLAFRAEGGDDEGRIPFDWRTKRTAVVERATEIFQLDLTGHGSEYWDYRCRVRYRKNRAIVAEMQWTAWRSAGVEAPASNTIFGRSAGTEAATQGIVQEYDYLTEQEVAFRDTQLGELVTDLAEVLNPQEVYLLVEHYLKQRSQVELAREMLALNGNAAPSESDVLAAVRCVWKQVSRARQRARSRLSDKWSALALETSEDAA